MSDPRAPYVHPTGDFMSIGFEDTNDTLLRMPEGWRDRNRVQRWAEAITDRLAELERVRATQE